MIKVRAQRDFISPTYGNISTGDTLSMTDYDADNLLTYGFIELVSDHGIDDFTEYKETRAAIDDVVIPSHQGRKPKARISE